VRASELSSDLSLLGAAGSPTWVKDAWLEKPEKADCKFIDCSDPAQAAQEVIGELDRLGVIGGEAPARRPVASTLRTSVPGKDVWVVYETDLAGQVTRGSLELLSAGDRLATELGGALVAVGFTAPHSRELLAGYGADRLIFIDHPAVASGRPESIAQAMAEAVTRARPFALLVSASERGRDWGPRLAARLGLGLTGDAIALELMGDGKLAALKPAFGGNVIAPILSKTYPQMATVRSGVLELADPLPGRGPIPMEVVKPVLPAALTTLVGETRLLDPALRPLEGAEIVVGAGAGLGGPEGIARVKEFARHIDAALCATRRVTDLGWLPRQLQVGLTGKAIEPRLYFAIGVRGVSNHTIGLKRIRATVAINRDREAPIFERAQVGLVADWSAVLPALEEALRARLKQPA
jgi:electron transfer flavoprotein alpha subunit